MSPIPAPPRVIPANNISLPATTDMPSDMPAHVKQYAEEATQASSLITGNVSVPSISIQGKQFTYDNNTLSMGVPLDVVILANDPPEGVAKSFYAKSFNPNSSDAPDCSSSNGKSPDSFIANPVSTTCTTCPHNRFGSGLNEDGTPSKGKRCSDFKNLFVVFPHNIGGDVYVLRVPATSLKALSAFGRHLLDKAVPMQILVVRLTFANATHPQLEFNAISWLAEGDAATAIERSKSDSIQNLLPSKYSFLATSRASELAAEGLLPAPVIDVHKMTEKAGGKTYEVFTNAGWDDKALIEHGYMESPTTEPPKAPAPAPPAPPPPAPVPTVAPKPKQVLTEKAGGAKYKEFIDSGWTDEQLIANGYMEIN